MCFLLECLGRSANDQTRREAYGLLTEASSEAMRMKHPNDYDGSCRSVQVILAALWHQRQSHSADICRARRRIHWWLDRSTHKDINGRGYALFIAVHRQRVVCLHAAKRFVQQCERPDVPARQNQWHTPTPIRSPLRFLTEWPVAWA